MIDPDESAKLAFRILGSLAGVFASLVMVAPEGTKNALYRTLIGVVMGLIFAPATQELLWFLRGSGWDNHLAAGAASGFTCWFILEGIARFLSNRRTVRMLLEEMARIREK